MNHVVITGKITGDIIYEQDRADYVGNELYQGCNVIITGRVCYRRIEIPNSVVNQLYVGCNTVSILEQEEYT